MKYPFIFGLATLLASCVPDPYVQGSGGDITIVDRERTLSSSDVAEIKSLVRQRNPRLNIIGMEVMRHNTVLVSVSPERGEYVRNFGSYEVIKSGGRWRFGNYSSGAAVTGY